MSPKIVVITGPTATGKTRLGVLLSRRLGGEVVSADSMQVYRGMDIGTAKPAPAEREGVPHHMLDVADPWESYSAARYVKEAAAVCDGILARGRLPLLVGGTGLYIDALVSGRSFAARAEDAECRAELNGRYDELGGEALLRELSQVDPERAAKLHPGDKKRIVRAFEVWLLTGKTITEHDEETRRLPPRYDAAFIIPGFGDRAALYRRIDARVDAMVAAGLVEEVRGLLAAGLSPDCTAMQAIGYKETAAALRGECTQAQAIETIKRESRRYAKRQLTWLRGRTDALRLDFSEPPDFEAALRLSTGFLAARGIR